MGYIPGGLRPRGPTYLLTHPVTSRTGLRGGASQAKTQLLKSQGDAVRQICGTQGYLKLKSEEETADIPGEPTRPGKVDQELTLEDSPGQSPKGSGQIPQKGHLFNFSSSGVGE